MTKQFLRINKEFLDENNYEITTKNSIMLNNKYGEFCELFRKEFQSLGNQKTELSTLADKDKGLVYQPKKVRFKFIEELKGFIGDFLGLLKEMSDYQIECLQYLKETNHPELAISAQIIQRVRQNKLKSEQMDIKRNTLVQSYAEIKKSYKQFLVAVKSPVVYYQPELITKNQRQFKEKMKEDWKIIGEILQKREEYQDKIEEFQPYLSTYRKKLLKNKYSVLKKLVYLVNNTKTAIIQIFDTLKNCAQTRRQDYLAVIERKEDDINYLRDYLKQVRDSSIFQHYTEQNKKLQKFTSQSIVQFQEAFEEIEVIVAKLISFFNNFCNKCSQLQESFRGLTLELNQFFQENESPYVLMKELFDVQIHFSRRIGGIIVKLQAIENRLRLEKNSCKKQAEILLTLIKVNKNNYKSFIENFSKSNELSEVIEKISFQTTKRSLVALYDQFINLQNELLGKLETYHPKKRKTFDSMEISHTINEFKSVEKKVPLRQQFWLWRDWKSQIEINFEHINDYFKEIEAELQKISGGFPKDSTTLQEHAAILIHSPQSEGKLILKINSLDFCSGALRICIPWKDILSVNVKSKLLKDFLLIETPKGFIQFIKIENIEAVMNDIKEYQEKSLMGNKKKVERKAEIVFTEEQLAVINSRKQKIQAELPSLKDFSPVVEELFSEIRIDQIYDIFYSDKSFSFYGREEPCFFSYTGKKAGNYNWVAEKFDKPGPEFYSLDKEVSFENCPLFSTRKITYNHPMKPSAIPFMPKFCNNTDTRKMYWVSNQQLLYVIQSLTEGVPYADHFLVELVHKIRKEGEGVKIQIVMHINWIKDTMMKSTIESSVIPEITENMVSFFAEVGKVLKLMKSLQKGENVQIPIQPQEDRASSMVKPSDELSKMKLFNKILLVAFGVLVLLNLLYGIIF